MKLTSREIVARQLLHGKVKLDYFDSPFVEVDSFIVKLDVAQR